MTRGMVRVGLEMTSRHVEEWMLLSVLSNPPKSLTLAHLLTSHLSPQLSPQF